MLHLSLSFYVLYIYTTFHTKFLTFIYTQYLSLSPVLLNCFTLLLSQALKLTQRINLNCALMEMDSSAQHHHQEMGNQTLENMLVCTKQQQQEKKPRPADQQALKCPRCDSANTKFCYYNNYSLSQPRYFCKSCRRYWTKGGTLRNVPVGGGCRKNKRSSSSSSCSSSSSKRNPDHPIPSPIPCLSHLSYDHDPANDLSLAIARLQKQSNGFENYDFSILGNPNMAHSEGLANSGVNTPTGFFDPGNGFHNVYYGMENSGMGMNGVSQEMGLGFEELGGVSNVVKQEMCNGREGENGRVLWGFPWHGVGGGEGSHIGELDSGRLGWNGIGASNWHGLLNSPLM